MVIYLVDMEGKIIFITRSYFVNANAAGFIEMLDPGNVVKQSTRFYLVTGVQYGDNVFCVPLRKNLCMKIGKIGYVVPSRSCALSGFDFRKVLIVNNARFLHEPAQVNISAAQMRRIFEERERIDAAFERYLGGYLKAVKKGRAMIDKLYKYSTLYNFHKELGL